MVVELQHEMKPSLQPEELARQRFVSGIRAFILGDLANDLRQAYTEEVEPTFSRQHGRKPETSNEVHAAMRGNMAFNVYSSMRVKAQKMVWASTEGIVHRELDRLNEEAAKVESQPGSFTLNPDMVIPRNVDAIDVHLMPGSYTRGGTSLEGGAVYDQGLAVFSMGLMGANLDDIGSSMAAYIANKFPEFQPSRILDTGCSIGHNTLPWKKTYPQAHVEAIDVAPGGLVYGSARAKMQSQEVHFRQMSADSLDYEDESFDLVFSSMFLHEISKKARANAFKEAHRVLKPGGLLLHMELPPNDEMAPFDGFFLDWDSWYNEEPFYKGYRDERPADLCRDAGFEEADFLQFTVPPVGLYGEEAVKQAIANESDGSVDSESTGRLTDGMTWFGFGSWKR